jgi:hypothetical protein
MDWMRRNRMLRRRNLSGLVILIGAERNRVLLHPDLPAQGAPVSVGSGILFFWVRQESWVWQPPWP